MMMDLLGREKLVSNTMGTMRCNQNCTSAEYGRTRSVHKICRDIQFCCCCQSTWLVCTRHILHTLHGPGLS